MDTIISMIVAVLALAIGGVVGYYIRQNLAKKRAGSLEAKLQKRVVDVKEETANMVKEAEKKSADLMERAQKDVDERRKEFVKAQQLLLSRETLLTERMSTFDVKEKELQEKGEKWVMMKEELETRRKEAEEKLEKVADLSREDANPTRVGEWMSGLWPRGNHVAV